MAYPLGGQFNIGGSSYKPLQLNTAGVNSAHSTSSVFSSDAILGLGGNSTSVFGGYNTGASYAMDSSSMNSMMSTMMYMSQLEAMAGGSTNNYVPAFGGISAGVSYQTQALNSLNSAATTTPDTSMQDMMSFMLQMKQMEIMTQTTETTTSTNSIATTSAEDVADPTVLDNFETNGDDLEEFRAFMTNQHDGSTLNISSGLDTFAENLITELNEEAGFNKDAENENKISLSRVLNSLGLPLNPTQSELLAYNMGIDPDEDLDAQDLENVLRSLGFKDGENNKYNLKFNIERNLSKMADTSKFNIQKYSTSGSDKNTMNSKEFEVTLDLFKEDAPESAKLNYGSLDNLSEQLLHATNARENQKPEGERPNNGNNVSLDELLNTLGIDADTMSEQEKKELMYKAGITTINKDYDDSKNVIERSKVDTYTPDYTNYTGDLWAGIGSTVGGVVAVGATGALTVSCLAASIGTMISAGMVEAGLATAGSVAAASGPIGWAIAAGVVAVAALGYGIYKICDTVSKDRRDNETQSLLNNANDTTTLNAGGEGIGLAENVEGNDRADNLSQDDIKKLLIALGFGEKSVTKTEFKQALDKDITFTKANIRDKNGNNIFDNFLSSLTTDDSHVAGEVNQTAINTLTNTILRSDETVKQAAIEAYFTDFPDFVDEFFEKALDQTADQKDTNVPYNVMSIKLFFKGAQDLINATTDPDKKSKYKQLYNAGIYRLQQFEGNDCLNVGGVNMAAGIAAQMAYKSGDITDSASGYPS